MWRVGLGYRRELSGFIESGPAEVGCIEVTAEHFFDVSLDRLHALRRKYPLLVHGLGLSLATPGRLDAEHLESLARVVRAADPLWVSEHVAFTRAGGIDLGHLNPVPPTWAMLDVLVEHARELADRCEKRLLLENITTHLRLDGEIDEPEFLNLLCARAGCGLLLDVTNLAVNAHNLGFDPSSWLSRIDPKHIVQLHLVGYRKDEGRYHDLHADRIQDEILDLTREVLERAAPEAIVLERDANFPTVTELSGELRRIAELRS
jgi:uncharacterized protein